VAAVGWVGLGKLGGPCAAALAHFGGHVVYGYDVRGTREDRYDFGSLPPIELTESVEKVVAETDGVVFLSVQTPHAHRYGGELPTPHEPRDFEYGFLINAMSDVCRAARNLRTTITLVIVSTVLPGTFNRYLRPLLNEFVRPVYHPFFIAMGTVVSDFTQPEMTLFGVDVENRNAVDDVRELYDPLHAAPAPVMSIESAELTKVAYNTFIGTKIAFANQLAELCEHTGADVDEVTDALALGTDRIVSPRYMHAGMGDGGACHPRDNVALSAVASRYDLSSNYMDFLIRARERHTQWLVSLVDNWADLVGLPVVVLGRAYKPEIDMIDGSPALLFGHYLNELRTFTQLDPVVSRVDADILRGRLDKPHVYFIATAHAVFADLAYPAGSVVIDPFGYVGALDGVTVVRPGRKG
jgi:UDPglucose 6-dehydrogenase